MKYNEEEGKEKNGDEGEYGEGKRSIFFPTEDGLRGLVLSRALGNVYKGQTKYC